MLLSLFITPGIFVSCLFLMHFFSPPFFLRSAYCRPRECVMAFMRVPSLDEEFGRDAAMGLNELGWGKELLGRALGRDSEGRLVSVA